MYLTLFKVDFVIFFHGSGLVVFKQFCFLVSYFRILRIFFILLLFSDTLHFYSTFLDFGLEIVRFLLYNYYIEVETGAVA